MRNVVVFLFLILFISCDGTSQKSKINSPTEVNGVTCEYIMGSGNYGRIITSKILSDTSFIRKVVDEVNAPDEILYFHLPEIVESGDEYAYIMNNNITLVEDAPTTKEEAILFRNLREINGAIEYLEISPISDLEEGNHLSYMFNIESAAEIIHKYEDSTNTEIKNKLDLLKKKLVPYQRSFFPKARKYYAENAKSVLWEEDIKVSHSGTTITFTGYLFATNRNIKEAYEAVYKSLHEYRFKRANFKWSDYGEYSYYTIKSPSDEEIK